MIELWLDDERDPNEPFIQKEFGARPNMVWVKTAWECISYLKKGNVVFLSLDHDLRKPEAGTGLDVAEWIEEQAFHSNLKKLNWFVHSFNIVGKSNMLAALSNADKYWED